VKRNGEQDAGSLVPRALDLLGLERNVLVMVAALSLQGFGMQLWAPYLSKVLEALGASPAQIGLFATLGVFMTAAAPYFGGLLSDMLGRGRQLILASAMALAGFVIYLVAPAWWVFIPGALLLQAADSFRFMGSLTLTGDRLRQDRRAVSIAVQNVLIRLPKAVAPPVGGQIIVSLGVVLGTTAAGLIWGFRIAVLITIVLTVAAILLQRRYYKLPAPKRNDGSQHPLAAFLAMNPKLKRFLLADCLVRFGNRMFMAFTVLYVMNVMGREAGQFGLLQGLLVLTSVTMYIPAAKLSDRGGIRGRRPFVAATFLFFALFPLALVWAPSAAWLILAFIIGGLREFGEPARKALIIDMIPSSRRGQQMGTYYMLRGAFSLPAPFLGGLLWTASSPRTPFVIGGLIAALGLAWFLAESTFLKGGVTPAAADRENPQ